MPTLTTGKTAPPIELTNAEGKSYSLKSALAQGPVLTAFFKVSCPTCQFTLPFIERLYQQFRGRNVQVWGVSQDNERDTQQFAREYAVTFPILIDKDHYATSRGYGLEYVPTLFLIAQDGRIEISSEGLCTAYLLGFQASLSRSLSATPGELINAGEKFPNYMLGSG